MIYLRPLRMEARVPELLLRNGINPEDPDAPVLLVIIDPERSPGERAVCLLGNHGYERDNALYLVPTDGWAERALDGGSLVVDLVAYPLVLGGYDLDLGLFTEPAAQDADAVRLLRVTGEVDATELPEATVVVAVSEGATVDDVVEELRSGELWPVVLAPARAPEEG
ncbi:hypothetical protein LV78_006189 [Actinosynnema pretiosum]|nr:hypothetical protein [Actinosynnema pretiosum]